MKLNNQPTSTLFGDVVAIDGWFAPSDKSGTHRLHVDVVFGTARIGGEEESKVRFRLAMKRADLVVILKDAEPAEIDKASISRSNRTVKAKKTSKKEKFASASASAGASLKSESKGMSGGAEFSAKGEAGVKSHSLMTTTENGEVINASQGITSDGYYKWELLPAIDKILNGRPWDPSSSPRFNIIDTRRDGDKRLPIRASIEIRCMREDLEITDIELKDDALWNMFNAAPFKARKIAAAEAYIRNKLMANGLAVGTISEKFADVVMAFSFVELE